MEQVIRKKKGSLVVRFRITIIKIVAATAAASLLTVLAAGYLFYASLNRDIYPADYYEQQLPRIAVTVREQGEALLSADGEQLFQRTIPTEGILYLVTDAQGRELYGTMPFRPFESTEELLYSYGNGVTRYDSYYIRTIPLIGETGMEGAVLLAYEISPTFVNSRGRIVFCLLLFSLFSPLVYVVLFTLYFSRRYVNRINQPLRMLEEAAGRVGEKNLDFSIDYHEDNELGRLCDAFAGMQEALKKALAAQWNLEQEKSEMVAALAHDLKSPLSLILAYVDALTEDYSGTGGELTEYLGVIRENAEKSAALVRQMQYVTELERMEQNGRTEKVNIREFLEKLLETYSLAARKQGVALQLAVDREVPAKTGLDRERITRILDNLISNSLQYTPAGGRITVAVRREQNELCYAVTDSGPGFQPMDLKKAFDKFYRGDASRSTRGGHAGLGLFIVRQLAEQLGGSVTASNVPTGGACVQLRHGMQEDSLPDQKEDAKDGKDQDENEK